MEKFAFLLLVALLFTSSTLSDHVRKDSGNASEEQPNIIFIMVDDMGYGDPGCYGQKKMKTPHIDRLASEGIRFTQAYAGGPVCTSSRSVLITGLHAGHTPARDNVPHYRTYLEESDFTMAEMLQRAGYRCGGVGKWSLGDPGTVGDATNQGFDMWFGYQNQDHAHYYFPEYLDDSYRAENDYRLELPGNAQSREFYSADLITERALQFIRDSSEDPFFLYAAFTLPHFAGRSEDPDGFAVPSTDPYTDMNWSDKAKKYAAMVHMVDQDVGQIVELVDDLGLSENTLIVFTSDNGGSHRIANEFNTNGPLRGFKADMTEGGIRVPFIARWPGQIPAGETSDAVIGFQDMMPTFAELSGGVSPWNIDGLSVVEALRGEKLKKQHDYLYWDYGHCRDHYNQAVRMGKWKGILMGEKGEVELYDLTKDIGEENDVASSHPEIVSRIKSIMEDAVTPSVKYPVGRNYDGKPIWKRSWD